MIYAGHGIAHVVKLSYFPQKQFLGWAVTL